MRLNLVGNSAVTLLHASTRKIGLGNSKALRVSKVCSLFLCYLNSFFFNETSHKNTEVPLIVFSKATEKLLSIFANARLRDDKKRLKMTGADADAERGEIKDQKGSFFLHKTFTPQDHDS